MPFSETSARKLICSSRAPLPRWKRATGSTGRPRALRACRKYQAAARISGSSTGSRVSGTCHQPSMSRLASASRSSCVSAREELGLRSRFSQAAKPGTGDSVTKVLRLRIVARDFLDHLLDQEIAEGHAGKAALAVGDRVEHRGVDVVRRPSARACAARIGAIASGISSVSATSTKISGSSIERRMEEGEAAAVRRIDAAAQIVPAPDLVHRLVRMIFSRILAGVDQSMSRSTRKPRLNQDENRWTKSASTTARSRAMRHRVEQLLAHAHQRGGAARREIEPAEQFLPARLGRLMHLGGGLVVRLVLPGLDRASACARGRDRIAAPALRRTRCADRWSAST